MEMAYTELNAKLCAFLDKTPNSFFAVKNIKEELAAHGFAELQENSRWQLQAGGKYYVSRNGSALLAFVIPKQDYLGFQVYACHCDSPAFKLKNNAEIVVDKKYVKLNVEKYGGMLLNTWLDRPLSVAGRVLCNVDGRLEARLVNVEQDLMMIPNLAIHMNREANEGVKLNAQTDMLPLIGSAATKDGLKKLLAEACGVTSEQIVDTELFLYNRMPATTVGLEQEYVAGGRLDDLQCVFTGLQGFLAAEAGESVPLFCMLDNEEVGSGTKQGAAATFLKDALLRINMALGRDEEDYLVSLANSLMLSADNAHAVHPNHTDKNDLTNKTYPNEGVVVKYSANQKYTTDAVSGALVQLLAKKANVPLQLFYNRSDMAGGSTLGNISTAQVAIKSVDIGLAQLAMHSAYEMAGVKDTAYLANLAQAFFAAAVAEAADGTYCLK